MAYSPKRSLETTEASICPVRHEGRTHRSQDSCRILVPCWLTSSQNKPRELSQPSASFVPPSATLRSLTQESAWRRWAADCPRRTLNYHRSILADAQAPRALSVDHTVNNTCFCLCCYDFSALTLSPAAGASLV